MCILCKKVFYEGRLFGVTGVGTAPQIEDAVPVPPNGGAGAPAGAYLEAAGGDALMVQLGKIHFEP
jgi:hypothetical protein